MQAIDGHAEEGPWAGDLPAISTSERRTLEAIFRHPMQHNLEWSHVVALVETLGEVAEKSNSAFDFRIGREHHIMRKPHTKDITSDELLALRHFLTRAGCSPNAPSEVASDPGSANPSLLVVMDHHGARIYHIDVSSGDASEHVIKPYDPHHFLHHMKHKDQSRERGQKPAEDTSYYTRIAEAVAAGGRIVVIGHGTGESNAAHHLTEYLRAHHRDIYARIVTEVSADLSSLTEPQLLARAAAALHRADSEGALSPA
jgi:hypothetical protein